MASLSEILQDPNYVSANAETKRAIFEKYAQNDSNYSDANPETQAKIRERFGVAPQYTPPADLGPTDFLSDLIKGKNEARQDVARNTVDQLPLIGSIVGGTAGALGGPVISAAGTALGTSVGTSAKQIIQNLSGEKELSPADTIKEQAINVGTQTAFDLAGSGVVGGINKLAKAVSPAIREGVSGAQSLIAGKGGSLSAAQVAESAPIELAEAFARSGAGGKHAFLQLDKANTKALDAITEDIISSASTKPLSDIRVGKLFQSAIKRGEDAHQYAASQLYANLDNAMMGKGIAVDTGPIKQFASSLKSRLAEINNVGKTEAGGKLIDSLEGLPPNLSFSTAHELRSSLLQTIRDLKASGSEGRAIMNATIAVKRLEAEMETSAKVAGPDFFKQYRGASEFYKSGKNAFDNDVIVRLMETQPERVGESLFASGNVSEIIKAKQALNEAQRFAAQNPSSAKKVDAQSIYNRMQAGYLRGMFGAKGATNTQGETVGLNILKELSTSKTDRTFGVMFSPEQKKLISDFGVAAQLALRNKPSGFGTLAPIVQASAALDLVSGSAGGPSTNSPLADIGILVSPYVLATMLTNPKTANMLITGLKLPQGSAALASISAKLSAEADRIASDETGR